jgi:microcystin-dependent protein
MSDISIYPTENQYESQIVGELSSGTTAPFNLDVENAPSLTLDAGQSIYFVIDPGTSKEEGITVNAISGTTLTVSARGLPVAKGGASTVTSHSGGAKIIITNNWQTFDNIVTAVNSKAGNAEDETITGDWIFSGYMRIPVFADAAARAAAIPTPANGMEYYQTDTGKFYDYTAGSWVERESGGTFANASTTVAGKVELATQAELNAGTATGGTGAALVATPDLDGMAEVQYLNSITAAHQITLPPGMIAPYAGASAPTGWLLCDGTTGKDSVADTTLAALYAVIGTTYGGTGADDFDLPDLRERVPVGYKSGGTFDPIGDTGGEETHLLTGPESGIAAHSHSVPIYTAGSGGYAVSSGLNSGPLTTSTAGDTNASSAHNNLQPYIVLNYIIKK